MGGATALLLLVMAVAADPGVAAATTPIPGSQRPSLILAILDAFGIIVPLSTVALALAASRIGLLVIRNDAAAIRIARDAATWIAILTTAAAATSPPTSRCVAPSLASRTS